jgi:hypothetical protein
MNSISSNVVVDHLKVKHTEEFVTNDDIGRTFHQGCIPYGETGT